MNNTADPNEDKLSENRGDLSENNDKESIGKNLGENEDKNNKYEDYLSSSSLDEATPKQSLELHSMIDEFKMFAMQQQNKNDFDISKFSEKQIDDLLSLISKNEDNAFAYHTRKLDTQKEIICKEIDASIIDNKTFKITAILIICIVGVISLIILLLKDDFIINWLLILTSTFGGLGIGQSIKPSKKYKSESTTSANTSEDGAS